MRPSRQAQQPLLGDEVARRVVGVDEQQCMQAFVAKERHQVVGTVFQVRIIGYEGHNLLLGKTMGIFLKGGIDNANPALHLLHQTLDEFCGSIAHNGVLAPDAEVFPCQQLLHHHARWVLGEQGVEAGPQLVLHGGCGEIGVHQIAVVEHLGEAPMSAVAVVEAVQHLVALGKDGRGNVKILHVVNLVPFLVANGQGLQVHAVDEGDDAQHLLVVFVQPHGLGIGIEEGHVFLTGELLAELVDVHRLVVLAAVLPFECFLRHEAHDVQVVVDGHHRSVHPTLVFRHQCQVGQGILQNHGDEPRTEDEVALDEQGIVLLQLLFGQCQRVDVVGAVVDRVLHILYVEAPIVAVAQIVAQLLSLIAHHDDHAAELLLRQLSEQTVDKSLAVHTHHALGVVACQLAQSAPHARCQNDCLHPLGV